MIRREFLKTVGASASCGFLPKTIEQDMPFLPTLEYLQEHNRDIEVFTATYSTRQSWSGFVYCNSRGGYDDSLVSFMWESGRWIAVDGMYRDKYGKLCYYEQMEWPDWIRKF